MADKICTLQQVAIINRYYRHYRQNFRSDTNRRTGSRCLFNDDTRAFPLCHLTKQRQTRAALGLYLAKFIVP